MILSGANRAPLTLLAAAIAGVLLWLAAAHVDRHTTGGYWAACGLVALAGLVVGLSQLRGAGGHPPAMLVAFLPVLVVAGWVLVAMQPTATWASTHVHRWSSDIHVAGLVHSLGTWIGVLAFGIGLTLATVVEPIGARRTATRSAGFDAAAADEPVMAERRATRPRVRERERDQTVVK